jgi:hypothetical protein
MRGMRGFSSVLGRGIINGYPVIAGSSFEVVGVESGRHAILTIACLQKNLFFASKKDIAIGQISRLIGTWVLILPHLWWG